MSEREVVLSQTADGWIITRGNRHGEVPSSSPAGRILDAVVDGMLRDNKSSPPSAAGEG